MAPGEAAGVGRAHPGRMGRYRECATLATDKGEALVRTASMDGSPCISMRQTDGRYRAGLCAITTRK